MEICPCNSEKPYQECCEPIIKGQRPAETAEELMRSRYTAFVKSEVEYILNTIHPDKRESHDEKTIRNWSQKSDWLNFEIVGTEKGGTEDSDGTVEFVAHFRQKGSRERHHEVAEFKKVDGTWYFYDGNAPTPKQFVRAEPKIGRNSPCPCGSGKKYKKCCG